MSVRVGLRLARVRERAAPAKAAAEAEFQRGLVRDPLYKILPWERRVEGVYRRTLRG